MKLKSIQFLRAIAVLLVVYAHSMDIAGQYKPSQQQHFYHLDGFGCIGVDLFFVISGFIITYVAASFKGVTQGFHFLVKRITRINPTYYIASLLYLGNLMLTIKTYPIHLNKIWSSLVDTILIIPTSGEIQSFSPLLVVGWTLSFEWLFYTLFLLAILFNIKSKTLILTGLTIVLFAFGRIYKPGDLRLQFITNPILLEFVSGMIICNAYTFWKKPFPTIGATCIFFLGITSYCLLIGLGFGNIWNYKGTITGAFSLNKFLLWGIPSSCIVAGCVFLEKSNTLTKIFNNKLGLLIGNASYSIYLTHVTFFRSLKVLYNKIGLPISPDILIWIQLIIAIAVGIGFYKLIEKPLLRYIHLNCFWNLLPQKSLIEKLGPAVR